MGILAKAPGALYDGATSLVDLIRRQFGDDIDGATQELVRMGGFPEPVARRIATGELPMDAESVAKRAQDQGYDLTSRWYHGTNDNFNEFDPEKVGSAYGVDDQGFYFTSSEDEAIKWAENAPNASSPKVMETVLSMENPWLIDAPNGRSPVEYFESGEGVFNRGQNAAVDYGVDSGYDGMVIRGGEEDMAIAFDPSGIRSPNAAFDPEYTGKNMMGNATVPLLGATALGTAGLLAVPALMKDGVFQHGATSTPVVERREPVRNQSGLLADVTDFGDEVFKSVRHAAGPLADVFMPYEGVNNYLKTVNDYDRQPIWWDRLGILDL